MASEFRSWLRARGEAPPDVAPDGTPAWVTADDPAAEWDEERALRRASP